MSNYRWSPSKSQRREFAQKMQNDSDFANAYNERKAAKKEKFYESLESKDSGSRFVPSKAQHDYAVFDRSQNTTDEHDEACNMVASAFACNEKCDHRFIHIVNELRRKVNSYC